MKTAQKLDVIIKKHILSTKINSVIAIMVANKKKCSPIDNNKPDDATMVYIKRTTTENKEDEDPDVEVTNRIIPKPLSSK